jgi:hypothetical protein
MSHGPKRKTRVDNEARSRVDRAGKNPPAGGHRRQASAPASGCSETSDDTGPFDQPRGEAEMKSRLARGADTEKARADEALIEIVRAQRVFLASRKEITDQTNASAETGVASFLKDGAVTRYSHVAYDRQ